MTRKSIIAAGIGAIILAAGVAVAIVTSGTRPDPHAPDPTRVLVQEVLEGLGKYARAHDGAAPALFEGTYLRYADVADVLELDAGSVAERDGSGVVVDRWAKPLWVSYDDNGTPKVRSSGPDRIFFTDDDVVVW